MSPLPLPLAIQCALLLVVTIAAFTDLRSRRIPNWLNISGLVLGFGLNIFFFRFAGALGASKGLLLALAVYLPLYILRGMGAGDVKLMAAVGALAGPLNWFIIFLATSLAGGVAAVALLLAKHRFTETCCNLYFMLKDLALLRAPHRTNPQLDFRNPHALRMPHGVLIAIGSLTLLILTFPTSLGLRK